MCVWFSMIYLWKDSFYHSKHFHSCENKKQLTVIAIWRFEDGASNPAQAKCQLWQTDCKAPTKWALLCLSNDIFHHTHFPFQSGGSRSVPRCAAPIPSVAMAQSRGNPFDALDSRIQLWFSFLNKLISESSLTKKNEDLTKQKLGPGKKSSVIAIRPLLTWQA